MPKARNLEREHPFASRQRRASRQAAKGAKIDALLVTHVTDVSYLSGFEGDDSFLLLGETWATLITDARYEEAARKQARVCEVVVRTVPMARAVADAARSRKIRRLGLQAGSATLRLREDISKAWGSDRIIAVRGVPSELRQIKDAGEIRAIRRAIAVAQKAFRAMTARGEKYFIGKSERHVAAELDHLMRLGGAEESAFETIVAAGVNSFRPHHRPGGRKIRRGDPVLIDWGARVDGYCSDLTRVVFTGTIPPAIGRAYEAVRQAQTAGISALRSGVALRNADQAARRLLAEAGYGEMFRHNLGHGIGREIHEAPALGQLSQGKLRAGMVVTVEPGVYLPGVGGVRLEDDVLIGPDGPEVLSSLPRTAEALKLR